MTMAWIFSIKAGLFSTMASAPSTTFVAFIAALGALVATACGGAHTDTPGETFRAACVNKCGCSYNFV